MASKNELASYLEEEKLNQQKNEIAPYLVSAKQETLWDKDLTDDTITIKNNRITWNGKARGDGWAYYYPNNDKSKNGIINYKLEIISFGRYTRIALSENPNDKDDEIISIATEKGEGIYIDITVNTLKGLVTYSKKKKAQLLSLSNVNDDHQDVVYKKIKCNTKYYLAIGLNGGEYGEKGCVQIL